MLIPVHWAEARVVGKVRGRNRVVRRFGWSETSAEQAQQMATDRATTALAELQAGRFVPARERKLAYGGQGLPIREQVLARHGDLVVTRNSYGAHCINEPDVLFADIDLAIWLPRPVEIGLRSLVVILLVGGLAACIVMVIQGIAWGFVPFAASAFVAIFIGGVARKRRHSDANRARLRQLAETRLRAAIAARPGFRAALYDTPAGLRVLLLHATFDPAAATTQHLLAELGTDPAYSRMCELQACFRARVSGKPWRMGVRQIVPRPGVWPVHPDSLPNRQRWIAEYEVVAARFAACRFRDVLGHGPLHPRCAEVQRVHDELSRARSGMPIA